MKLKSLSRPSLTSSGSTRGAECAHWSVKSQKIARKAITKIMSDDVTKLVVDAEDLNEFLGVKKFRYGEVDTEDQVGVVTGLAWTEVGGELLQVESVKVPGKGKVTATGKLGDVMKESIQAAGV